MESTTAPENGTTERAISAALLRLRVRNPFMAALALFARYEVTDRVPTAATDGRTIYFNPAFWEPLTPAEREGLLLHEILHCALGHNWRRGVRDPQVWNIAADIIINGIILAEPEGALPKGGMRDLRLEKFGTEEVYELLQREFHKLPPLQFADLLTAAPGAEAEGGMNGDTGWTRCGERRWPDIGGNAIEQAGVIARAQGGHVPAGLAREFDALDPARLDWRAVLWRYLVQTPCDFAGWDRRFLARGLYLEQLEGETVRIFICVDTSGSVADAQMGAFLGEVAGILRAYPHLEAVLYYADAALDGPHRLDAGAALPTPKGGGGTDFRPFFAAVERSDAPGTAAGPPLAIYLTDGAGTFPERAPGIPTLWVVTPGGISADKFPFGESVRLIG